MFPMVGRPLKFQRPLNASRRSGLATLSAKCKEKAQIPKNVGFRRVVDTTEVGSGTKTLMKGR